VPIKEPVKHSIPLACHFDRGQRRSGYLPSCRQKIEVRQILNAIGEREQDGDQLLPVVYTELRRLASQKLAVEKPGQTLWATALEHEA